MTRPLLLLDGAGVLLFETDAKIISQAAKRAGVDPAKAAEWMEQIAYSPFWGGDWTVKELCLRLHQDLGGTPLNPELLEREWRESCRPTEALNWAKQRAPRAELWLLSDHRTEWIRYNMGSSLSLSETLVISDQQGITKKDPAYYEIISHKLAGREATYVDDRPENLSAMQAAAPQVRNVKADPAGKWGKAVSHWLFGGA